MRACALILPWLLLAARAGGGELPPNQWLPVNEPPMGVQLLGWDELRYAPDLEGVLFYGAYRSYTSENQNAIWLYRFRENRWRLLHINMFVNRDELASDGGHTSGKMIYDESRKVLVYGGLVSMSRNDRARTWAFDPRALAGWDANPPPPIPGVAFDGASAYAPELKGCFQYAAGHGAWLYDATANRWSALSKEQGPPATADVAYDAKRRRVLAFGGSQGHYAGKPFKTFNDLWAFDLAAKTWQKLEAKNPPPARGWPQMAISTAADALLLCGGFSGEMTPQGVARTHQDTWVLDLTALEWSRLEKATPPPTSYSNHLAYDPANDVFLLVSGATPKNLGYGYQCAMYALKYQGKQAAKAEPAKAEPPPAYDFKALPRAEGEWAPLGGGSVSAVQGWAFRPSLAARGNELLLAFGEYDPPGKYGDEGCSVYAFKYAGGQWSRLGARAVSEPGVHSQTPSAAFDAAGRPAVAYQAIKPWVPVAIITKRFDGEWKPLGALETGNTLPALPALAGGDKPLAVAWQHHPGFLKGIGTYVAEVSGDDKWRPVADGKALNIGDPTTTRGQFPALVRDPQGRLVVAWSEQKAGYEGQDATPERLHARRLEGGKWAELGKELPAASPPSRALGFALGIHDGEPVVALCEGTDGGRASLLVYACKGGQWARLGDGPLNVLGPEAGALKPALVSDGKNLFVAWPEFLPSRPPLLFVKKWDGAKWALVGGPLNEMPGKGSAHTPALAVLDGKPVVAWTEHDLNGERLRQLFVKALK